MTTKELTFLITRKNILNSNTMTGLHYQTKGRIAGFLRELGYQTGYDSLPENKKDAVNKRKQSIDSESNNKVIKTRITKQIKKENPNLTKKELDELVLTEYSKMVTTVPQKSNEFGLEPEFNKFAIKVYVSSPTARRLDPANLYPTVKHLIDGLTDCNYWDDDDWNHLHEISFLYDGVNDSKDCFGLRFVITEIN